MFRTTPKTAIALVTIGSLAAPALVPTSAWAFYGRGNYASHGNGGPPHAAMIRRPGPPVVHLPHPHPHWHFGWWHHRHYWITPVIGTDYVATTGRCTCLTKEYLPDGSVLFKDVCTQEEAMAPSPERQASEDQQSPNQRPQPH